MDFVIDEEFRQRNRKQTKQERLYLEALIEEYDCDDGALTVCQIAGAGPYLLVDGHNTVEICREKGKPTTEPRLLFFKDRQEALEWIDRKQEGRRNLSTEELEDRAARRRQRVDAARAEGKSVRTIAKEEGVSPSTIHDDLNICERCKRVGKTKDCPTCQELTSGVRRRTPAGKPEPKVQGADSKEYSPSKPKSTRKSKNSDGAKANSKPLALDSNGKPPGAIKCSACNGQGWITKETRDELWDAVVDVTGADSKVNGPRIGKIVKLLLSADPPYSAADIRKLPGIVKQRWPNLNFSFHIGNLERYVGWIRQNTDPGAGMFDSLKRFMERGK